MIYTATYVMLSMRAASLRVQVGGPVKWHRAVNFSYRTVPPKPNVYLVEFDLTSCDLWPVSTDLLKVRTLTSGRLELTFGQLELTSGRLEQSFGWLEHTSGYLEQTSGW